MARFITLLLAALFACVQPAFADWSAFTQKLQNFKDVTGYTHTWTGAGVNSTAVNLSACTTPSTEMQVRWDPSIGDASRDATVQLRECRTASTPIAECGKLKFEQGESESDWLLLQSAQGPYLQVPYVVAEATGATAGGDTAQVDIRCLVPHEDEEIGGAIVQGNYGGATPVACSTNGDLHLDLDTNLLWECTDAATEAFRRVGSAHSYHFGGSALDSTGEPANFCLNNSAFGNPAACADAAGLTTTAYTVGGVGTPRVLRIDCTQVGGTPAYAAGQQLRLYPVFKQWSGGVVSTSETTTDDIKLVFTETDDDVGDTVSVSTVNTSTFSGPQLLVIEFEFFLNGGPAMAAMSVSCNVLVVNR